MLRCCGVATKCLSVCHKTRKQMVSELSFITISYKIKPILYNFALESPQFPLFFIFLQQNVCHENKSAVCRVVVRNFGRDGGRPTTFGEQALIVNHFMLLWWKQMGSERWIESLPVEVGKVWDKEVSESKPFDEASLANQATSEPGFVLCSGIMAEETCIAVCWVCGV